LGLGLAVAFGAGCHLDNRALKVGMDDSTGAGGASTTGTGGAGTGAAGAAAGEGGLMASSCADAGAAPSAPGLGLVAGAISGPPFTSPSALANLVVTDPTLGVATNRLYVADNHALLQLLPETGAVDVAAKAGAAPFAFGHISDVTSDGADALYVADDGACVIRRVRVSTGEVTTLAGAAAPGCVPSASGSHDGKGAAAGFSAPQRLKFCGDGDSLFVADGVGVRKIRVSTGAVTTVATVPNGVGALACIAATAGSLSAHDTLYVVGFDTSVQSLDAVAGTELEMVATLAQFGATLSANFLRAFYFGNNLLFVSDRKSLWKVNVLHPDDVEHFTDWPMSSSWGLDGARASGGAVGCLADIAPQSATSPDVFYMTDSCTRRIRLVSADAVTSLGASAGIASLNGNGACARFAWPTGLALDDSGDLYVADGLGLREIAAATGAVTSFPDAVITARPGTLWPVVTWPIGLAFDGVGTLYVADPLGPAIHKVATNSGTVSALVATPPTVAAPIPRPTGLALDRAAGKLYVSDVFDHAVHVVDVATGTVGLLTGQPGTAGSMDGDAAHATFVFPAGLALDKHGRLFVADAGVTAIRQIDVETGSVTTIAGAAGTPGVADAVGLFSRFEEPIAIATDGDDVLYVADAVANTIRRIEISTGMVSTLVGQPSVPADAQLPETDLGALPGRLFQPRGVAVGAAGALYLSVPNAVLVARSPP
jgi:DNA-binding beta-propeller fold protein YncE